MVADTNHRYEHLLWLISERLEDLELMLQFMERCGGVFGLLDWANETETKLNRLKPTSCEIEPLEDEIREFRVIVADIASKKVSRSNVCVD